MALSRHVKWILWFCLGCLLSACSTESILPETTYSKQVREHLYKLDNWSFDGRLAISGRNDSWSASISWNHDPRQEKVKLSGPLGQGATTIALTDDFVRIDRGNGNVQTSDQPEDFVSHQLGVFVPIQSLRYWVIGLPEPTQSFLETTDGFTQAGWLVSYKETQNGAGQSMPRRISVVNPDVKLKLIIDQWTINNENGK
jgi:outer membrane lipoprotein LolB